MKKFAFLVHPRNTKDVARKVPLIKALPPKLIELIIEKWGFSICSHFKVFKSNQEAEGYIIGIGFTGKRMIELSRAKVRKKILETILFAQNKLGVEIFGLGSLTTSVTDGGKWLIQQPEVRLTITHGDSYGVVVAEEGIEKILNFINFNPNKVKIAIVGAYGLIGRTLSKIFVGKNYHLILIEKREEKLNLLREYLKRFFLLKSNILKISTDLNEIRDSEIIITATSHPGALLKSEYLKKGAIIYDIAQPMNVSSELIKERPDIIKIDGAYVDIDGIDLKFDMGPPKGTTFACLVETMMMALEGANTHHVGEIEETYLEKTKEWAKKYGFSHAPFTCFGKPISLEDLKRN